MAINPQIQRISYRTVSAANRGFSGRTSSQGEGAYILITDYRQLIRELGKVDRELVKQLKSRYREIAQDVRDEIKREIPSRPPLSGMRKAVVPGRVTWGTGKPARSAIIRQPRSRAKGRNIPISQIMVGSPATIIADMAGKSNRETAKKKIAGPYRYSASPTGTRTHRINPVGSRKFINNLDRALSGKASRMVYPAAERKLDNARDEMQEALNYAAQIINNELRDVSGS